MGGRMTAFEILISLTILTYTPIGDEYRVGVRPVGIQPVDACGISMYNRAGGDIDQSLDIGDQMGWLDRYFTFTAPPDTPGEPDLVIRAFCENEKGRTYSLQVACLDRNLADCERICGDMDSDLRISGLDFALIRAATVRGMNPDYCDVTGDQLCTAEDFYAIRQHIVTGFTTELQQTCVGKQG
jgi:hypothetical protein